MTPKEKYIAIISNDTLKKADAIVVLEGDGLWRIAEGARLYKEGWAPVVVLSGGLDNPPHSIPVRRMLPHLLAEGVPEDAVLLEEKSQHTRHQADEVAMLSKERGWRSVIIVASHYHQYRAFLTFLKAFSDAGADRAVLLINAPVRDLTWFEKADSQDARHTMLESEFERIERYGKEGHLATFEDAIAYQAWKESQL